MESTVMVGVDGGSRPAERVVHAGSRTHLFYDARDFGLYLFSLAIVWGAAWVAFAKLWLQVVFTVGMVYLAFVFVLKRGARVDWSTPVVLAKGLLAYPGRVLRTLGTWMPVRVICVFGLAVLVELAARRHLDTRSVLLRPFPYVWVFVAMFMAVTLFRTGILAAHLKNAGHVRSVLEGSPWKHQLGGLRINNHALHAYVTGLVSHVCYLIPALAFWRLTKPTYAREAVLFGEAIVVLLFRAARHGGQAAFEKTLVPPAVVRALTASHASDHKSRFNFAVLHGHHHDAMPSALMASGESGFGESIDRGISYLTFLGSATWMLFTNAIMTAGNMVGHQYIPGVYPFSKFAVGAKLHHVAHHYGSLRPLGLGGAPSYGEDVREGYDPSNGKVRWFLEIASQYGDTDLAKSQEFVKI